MVHDLAFDKDGKAKFAYNALGGAPWHMLGTPVTGLQTVDEILTAAGADYEVRLTRVAAVDDNGRLLTDLHGYPVVINDTQATVRVNSDGTVEDLSTVGSRYEVRQNREIAERALAVVGASAGDAVIDTCGVLRGGRRFFMTIDLGATFVDPAGVNDRIDRYLVVSHGHDGVWPIRYANTDVRAVCSNTVMLGIRQAQRVFTARHTRNVDETLEDAREVLNISTKWGQTFAAEAERLLRVPVSPAGLDRVIDQVFPKAKANTDRQRRNRDRVVELVRALYGNRRNSGGYGQNGWALCNAVTEYLDHFRDADLDDRAMATMDDNSWVTRLKVDTHRAVLALQ